MLEWCDSEYYGKCIHELDLSKIPSLTMLIQPYREKIKELEVQVQIEALKKVIPIDNEIIDTHIKPHLH